MFLRFQDGGMIGLSSFEEILPPSFDTRERMWSVRAKRANSHVWFTLFKSDKKERTQAYFDNLSEKLESSGAVIHQTEIEPK